MENYAVKLKAYVEQDKFAWKERKAEGILDYLEQCYLEENPVESEETKAIEKEMGPIYEALRVGLHLWEELGRL